MQINVTFLIQIANFWITYLFLHKLLFKPLVRTIAQKEAGKAMLLDGLKEKEGALVRLQEDKKQGLDEFKLYIRNKYEVKASELQTVPQEISYNIDYAALDDVIGQAQELLIKKARNVH